MKLPYGTREETPQEHILKGHKKPSVSFSVTNINAKFNFTPMKPAKYSLLSLVCSCLTSEVSLLLGGICE